MNFARAFSQTQTTDAFCHRATGHEYKLHTGRLEADQLSCPICNSHAVQPQPSLVTRELPTLTTQRLP